MSRNLIIGHMGSVIDLDNIAESKIVVGDIPYRLARINRFNGGTLTEVSVLEHSVALAHYAKELKLSNQHVLWALVHDCAEAFLGDIVAPVKKFIGMEYHRLEAELLDRILQVYAINGLLITQSVRDEVSELDQELAFHEWYFFNDEKLINPQNVWGKTEKDLKYIPMNVLGSTDAWTPAGLYVAWEKGIKTRGKEL